jgi:aspartyl-tRNA(Asn)/glutamyl-tRNA(Gln) amidotransferase subunit C
MTTIDRKLVLHVANLANLSLTDEEVGFYQAQLSRIVDYIAQIDRMPDDLGDAWRGDVLGGPAPERDDVVLPSLAPDEVVASAPRKVGTAFQVPRIIE